MDRARAGIAEEDLTKAASLIAGASLVALACHVVPDGDALGSMLALHHVFRAAGIPSLAAFAGPQVIGPHVSNTRFGSVHLIDPSAAASAVIVARLIEALGLPLNREAAVCLYAGLVCDTGRFQYESANVDAFELARRLLDFDVPVARLNRAL